MKLERKAMLTAVDTVKPGLSNKAQIDAFAHVWFNGETVLAYNDADLGMELPFVCELKGGLRGNLLLGMLNASRAKEIEITPGEQKGELLLKAGGTKLTLPLLPTKSAVWAFPDLEGHKAFNLTKELLEAVQDVMLSTGDPEPSVPEKFGVTFEQSKRDGFINVYTTDSLTLSGSSFAAPKGYKLDRVTIPTPFWKEVLARCKKGGRLYVLGDCAIAESSDNLRIFAKLVSVPRPSDFNEAMAAVLPKNFAKAKQPIPPRMPLAFQRAAILLEGHESESVKVRVRDNKVYMSARSSYGELKEVIALEGNHDDVEVLLDPSLVKRGMDAADSFLLTPDCMALFRPGHAVYLVSACVS